MMRAALLSVGSLLLLVGTIWVLQGLNVLPGSFMTGQAFWAFMGAACLLLGGGLLYAGLRDTGDGVRRRGR